MHAFTRVAANIPLVRAYTSSILISPSSLSFFFCYIFYIPPRRRFFAPSVGRYFSKLESSALPRDALGKFVFSHNRMSTRVRALTHTAQRDFLACSSHVGRKEHREQLSLSLCLLRVLIPFVTVHFAQHVSSFPFVPSATGERIR